MAPHHAVEISRSRSTGSVSVTDPSALTARPPGPRSWELPEVATRAEPQQLVGPADRTGRHQAEPARRHQEARRRQPAAVDRHELRT
jgi:hypothetical protein